MDMKKILFSLICLTGTLLLPSCSDETIDTKPAQFVNKDVIYTNSARILQFVNNLYTFLPKGYNRLGSVADVGDDVGPTPGATVLGSMVASATDEAVHASLNSGAEKWGTGNWGTAPSNNWDAPLNTIYTGIRRTYDYTNDIHANLIVAPVSNVSQITAAQRDEYYGQAIFIRALLNFELLKRFGGYPIVREALSADGNLVIPKSSYDECVTYIAGLCDEAVAVLPVTYAAGDFGRATKGAALALKGRLLLYAASPLNNAGNLLTKWQAAAAANAAVINLKNGAAPVYSLYTAGTGYDAFFTTLVGNNEIILSRIEPANSAIEQVNGLPQLVGGLGGTNPTLDLVNDYEMKDGTRFNWSNPTHANAPFANRDPRFDKSILYNGVSWMGVTVETFEGGKDKTGINPTRTGFFLRKFMGNSTKATWVAPAVNTLHCFPIFRYGETLLNYAEAMNEAYGPDDPATYGLTARQAIALIRTRAGLTANQTVPSATNQSLMRDAIRHERRIELAFEEHRHLDLRRWNLAVSVLNNKPVSGLKIVRSSTQPYTFTYTPEVVENRVFTDNMYRYPFPKEEVSRNPGIQNPGW
jgi:hypothetical protein